MFPIDKHFVAILLPLFCWTILVAKTSEIEDNKSSWSYKDQASWANKFPECKGSKLRQSPIDIITNNVTHLPNMRLSFLDYNQEIEFKFANAHHSIKLTPSGKGGKTPAVRLDWLDSKSEFQLQEIHFHWGDGENKGSEHEVNDQPAAAEMHMVHYRKGVRKEEINKTENSVVVIGVFIESDEVAHNKLEGIVRKSSHINGTRAHFVDESTENLFNLLPESLQSFYAYNGSLTTPPCYEIVTWIIMSEPVYMAQEQLVQLSNIETQSGKQTQKISSNRRDIQPLLDRPVYASFTEEEIVLVSLNQEEESKAHEEVSSMKSVAKKVGSKLKQAGSALKRLFG